MSTFQRDNEKFILLEKLIRFYNEVFLSKPNEATKRVNPTGSEDTTRRDRSGTKIIDFESQTILRTKKCLLKEINRLISEIEGKETN